MNSLAPMSFADRRAQDRLTLIDVRSPAEFRAVHADVAELVPLDTLDEARVQSLKSAARPVAVICKSGARSDKAVMRLRAGGVDAVSIEGGTDAWLAAGLPVVRGKAGMSLERQVRLTAGSLMLLGLLLGWLIHPAFALLSAFIGAGLVFSALTNTCGMGNVLLRMPWTR